MKIEHGSGGGSGRDGKGGKRGGRGVAGGPLVALLCGWLGTTQSK